ncbi:hypothetical protein WDJ51_02115 [Rathayibacter sp. YIM 133350]|uniref:hypothetical protein n=1 Tax=Rathayibacter sp. YIM 133350 TaxID=3131992 RepID=UPI00307F3F70
MQQSLLRTGTDVAEFLRENGLFLSRRRLRSLGVSDFEIEQALSDRTIFRVRQGWYSLPDASPVAIEAVRIGGRLTGESALASYGIWVRPKRQEEVLVRGNANELRRPADSRRRLAHPDAERWRVFWSRATPMGGDTWRVSLMDALGHLLATSTREVAVACIDSALNRSMRGHDGVSVADLDTLFDRAPKRVARWRSDVDGRAEAGGETLLRLLCRDNGIPFEPQVTLPGVGRLDGRIGPSTFVEADGAVWHDSESSFHVDRDRDLVATIWGGRVLRFGYSQILYEPEYCLTAMEAALSRDGVLSGASRRRSPL